VAGRPSDERRADVGRDRRGDPGRREKKGNRRGHSEGAAEARAESRSVSRPPDLQRFFYIGGILTTGAIPKNSRKLVVLVVADTPRSRP
jgi:hypothetical protein